MKGRGKGRKCDDVEVTGTVLESLARKLKRMRGCGERWASARVAGPHVPRVAAVLGRGVMVRRPFVIPAHALEASSISEQVAGVAVHHVTAPGQARR